MIKIIKKDNALQDFDANKIINAIRKSADRACTELTHEQENAVINYVEKYLADNKLDTIEVNKLHSIVECALDNVNEKAAKCYRDYRNYKKNFLEILDHVYAKKMSLSSNADRSNANADSALATTQKSIVYNELNSEFYKKFFLTEEERKAMTEGYIYVHDRGARLDVSNCCLFDMKSVLTGGFEMGNMHYNEPKTVGTAIQLMTDIMFNAGSSQYGGFTVSEVDKLLSKYAEKSYNKYYDEFIENYKNLAEYDDASEKDC